MFSMDNIIYQIEKEQRPKIYLDFIPAWYGEEISENDMSLVTALNRT